MRRRQKVKVKIVILGFVILFVGILGTAIVSKMNFQKKLEKEAVKLESLEKKNKEQAEKINQLEEVKKNSPKKETNKLPWNLVLVNKNHPMEEGYVPELTELMPDYSVDSRIAKEASQMLADAEAAGLEIELCSAYRSVDRQEQLFNESVQDRLNWGLDYWEAFSNTRQSVAEPRTSEHALGLALDLISSQYSELDEGQRHTKEAKWLAENCHKYGFILRYPPEKTAITNIIYEPWHYRYVGVEDATKIMELGITLEEYLEKYY